MTGKNGRRSRAVPRPGSDTRKTPGRADPMKRIDAAKSSGPVRALTRERYSMEAAEGEVEYFIRGTGRPCRAAARADGGGNIRQPEIEEIAATAANDVVVPIPADPPGRAGAPECPDCGDRVENAELGGTPGSRRCSGCGSRFKESNRGIGDRKR